MTTKTSRSRGDRVVLGQADPAWSQDEREIMRRFGFLDDAGRVLGRRREKPQVARERVTSLDCLNEAYDYDLPSSFSRGLAVTVRSGQRLVWISGTASIDDEGVSVHKGDFRAQTWRTFWNLTRLIESEGGTWHDVVRTSCYLRDIDRDYDEFNKTRTLFFRCMDLDPLPASTGIQAKLCRPELLIEIEAIVMLQDGATS
jgi:enamine deaminase RidA (YjgF/YER057c/UK114 family)